MIKNYYPILELVHDAKYYRTDLEPLISFYDDEKKILFKLYDDDFVTYEAVDDIEPYAHEDIHVVDYFDDEFESRSCKHYFIFDGFIYRVKDFGVTKEEI